MKDGSRKATRSKNGRRKKLIISAEALQRELQQTEQKPATRGEWVEYRHTISRKPMKAEDHAETIEADNIKSWAEAYETARRYLSEHHAKRLMYIQKYANGELKKEYVVKRGRKPTAEEAEAIKRFESIADMTDAQRKRAERADKRKRAKEYAEQNGITAKEAYEILSLERRKQKKELNRLLWKAKQIERAEKARKSRKARKERNKETWQRAKETTKQK